MNTPRLCSASFTISSTTSEDISGCPRFFCPSPTLLYFCPISLRYQPKTVLGEKLFSISSSKKSFSRSFTSNATKEALHFFTPFESRLSRLQPYRCVPMEIACVQNDHSWHFPDNSSLWDDRDQASRQCRPG